MKYSVTAKKIITYVIMWSFLFQNTAAFAVITNIQADGRTQTNIQQKGNEFNVSTSTNVGDLGVNSFKKFDVGQGSTVNLNLQDSQNKLLNLVYDNSTSQINGIVNSYKNGAIGGNVMFANSKGFVIGKDGVFNVGSLSLMTPSQKTMDSMFKDGQIAKQPITDLISYQIDENRLLKLKSNIALSEEGKIDVAGKINARKGVDLIAGKEVTVSGEIKANTADVLVNTPNASFTTAISDGNNIIIVTGNDFKDTDERIGTLVNISGTVDAGAKEGGGTGRDVLVLAQSDKTHNKAEVNIKSGAKISGNNVDIKASQNVSDFSNNSMNITDEDKENALITDDIAEYFSASLAELTAKVTIESGAEVVAIDNLNVATAIHADLSSTIYMTVMAINYARLDVVSQAVIQSGAEITAKNLKVSADTDIDISVASKSTSKLPGAENKLGDLAVTIFLENLNTKAFIENGAILKIGKNVDVLATSNNKVDTLAKNGIVPFLDKNKTGAFSGSIMVDVIDVQTKAKMDADLSIKGALNVVADSKGQLYAKTDASAGGEGSDGDAGRHSKTFIRGFLFGESSGKNAFTQKINNKLEKQVSRGEGKFNDFDLTAAIAVGVSDYVTEATIGSETVKPTITAKNINVNAQTINEKSNLIALSKAENAATAIGGAVAININDLQTRANANGSFTLTNTDTKINALNITSKTEILHPMAHWEDWNDFVNSLNLKDIFSKDTADKLIASFKKGVVDADGNFVLPDMSDVTEKFSSSDLDLLFRNLNGSNFGLEGAFNTYAQGASNAKAKTGDTQSFSGAIAVSVFDTLADARLGNGSTVSLQGANSDLNKTNIASSIKNASWAMSAIMNPLAAMDLGAGARDGSSYGAGITFNYADNNASASIGEGVVIAQKEKDRGNVTVSAETDLQFRTISLGTSSADETGMSGAVGLTLIGGTTQAFVGKNSNLQTKDLSVTAKNKANLVNTLIGLSYSDKSIAFGISGIGVFDNIKAYIDGQINAEGNVTVNAAVNRDFFNVVNNMALAKDGTNPPPGSESSDSQDVFEEEAPLSLADSFVGLALGEDKIPSRWAQAKNELSRLEKLDEETWGRPIEPDKETGAYAGSIGVNVVTSKIEAYIADGATVKSEGDIKIAATVDTLTLNQGGVISAKGKTGGGGTVLTDVMTNTVLAGIGKNATVDARKALDISALQDYISIQAGLGIAQAKNSSGAGTMGALVQVNTSKAYIGEGAKINQNEENPDVAQSVSLNAKNETLMVKGLGALAVQKGASQGTESAKAIGGTIDGNILVNTAEAVIEGAENNRTAVKAKKTVEINAVNKNTFINTDIAGSVSTGGSAYAGLASANVVINDTNAGMKYTDMTGTADVDVQASDEFKEIIVAGAGAFSRDTAVGASVRADVLYNNINTFVENSDVTANSLDVNNKSEVNQISVVVSAAASNNKDATVGSIATLIALSNQNSHIKNSTITTAQHTKVSADHNLSSIAVTGGLAASNAQSAVGGSLFALVARNNLASAIENSNVVAQSVDVNATSASKIKAITAGGSLAAGGSAYQGSISVLTDIGDTAAFIDGGSITASTVQVGANKTDDIVQANGQVSVSLSDKAAGGAVATTVQTNKVTAYIQNATVDAIDGVVVLAKSVKNFISTPVGVSAGSGFTAQGSVDTYVLANVVDAYIQNSTITTNKDVSVRADDLLGITSATGGASVSWGGAAVGGSVFTAVLTGHNKAYVRDVTFSSAMKNLEIVANSKENLDIYGISGSVSTSGFAATGVVQTIVLNKDTQAFAENLTGTKSIDNVLVQAIADTDLDHGAGQAAVSVTSAGAGGSVETLVVNKKVTAKVDKSNISVKDAMTVAATSTFDDTGAIVGVSVGSSAAVQGAVSTKVFDIDVSGTVDNSTVTGSAVHKIIVQNTLSVTNVMATLAASGTASVGGTVGSIINNSSAIAGINQSDISGKSVKVDSSVKDEYMVALVNGAASGTVAVAGGVNTIVVNTDSEAFIKDKSVTTTGDGVKVTAKNNTDMDASLGQAAASGVAAIGASVSTLVLNKKTIASVEQAKIETAGALNVSASSIDHVFSGVIGGAASGTAAVVGSINTVVFDNETRAMIDGGNLTIEGDTSVRADETATLGGFAGAAVGAGVAAVGASVFTGVVNNKTEAQIKNTFFQEESKGNLSVIANTVEKIGSKILPLFNIAGSGAGVANVNGVVNSFVITSETNALLNGVQTLKQNNTNTALVQANANTSVYSNAGSVGGAGVASVGATVNTIVLNKNVSAVVDESVLKYDDLSVIAAGKDDLFTTTIAGGGAGIAAVNGAVGTHVVQNTINAAVKNSTVRARNVSVSGTQDTDLFAVVGSVSGAVVGVGASVLTNVLENKISAIIDGDVSATTIAVSAKSDENFTNNTVSGSGGAVAVAGAVNTNVIGNEVNAVLRGKIKADKTASVTANDTLTFDEQATGVASAGGVGAGASVQTNVVNNVVKSGVGGKIDAGKLTVSAAATENMTKLFALGFAVGGVAGAGTTLVNTINTQVLAYSEDNTQMKLVDKMSMMADSKTHLNALTTTGVGGALGGVGAAVVVNTIGKNIQSYTGKNNTLTANVLDIKATSTNNLGDEENAMKTIAGVVSGGLSIAGSVLVNSVNDVVVAGLGNGAKVNAGSVSISALNNTSLYTDVGMGSAGFVGVGAMVNVNTVNNTTNAFVGDNAIINVNQDFDLNAKTVSKLVNNGYVVGGGAFALSGGAVVSNIGSTQAELSGDTSKNADSAKDQAAKAIEESQSKTQEAKNQIASTKKQVQEQTSDGIQELQDNTNTTLANGLKANLSDQALPEELQGYYKATNIDVALGLPVDTGMAVVPAAPALKSNMTAAVVGKKTQISANTVAINATDESNVKVTTYGANFGLAAIGVSGGAANVASTTQAFVDDGAVIKSQKALKIGANSTDVVMVNAMAASGGAVSASGTFALANSNKITHVGTGTGASLISLSDAISIVAKSDANANAYATGGNFGALAVGAAFSSALAGGKTSVGLGQSNKLTAAKSVDVSALSDMTANANANALAGALIGGVGADAHSVAGQTVAVDVGGDSSMYAGATIDTDGEVVSGTKFTDNISINATGKNKSTATANARSYGVISSGGAGAIGEINAINRINFADGKGATASYIKGQDVKLVSDLSNDVFAKTLSGAGGLIGIGGSKSQTKLNAQNTVNIGKKYDINATRYFGLLGNTANAYRSYLDSSAYGLVASGAGIIDNYVNSNVFVKSFADNIYSGSDLSLYAANATTKKDYGYDLEGGAGGVVGVGSAKLSTNVSHDTKVELGGESVVSKGALNVLAENNVDITEKVKVDAAGGVPIAAGYANVNRDGSSINAETKISNKNLVAEKDMMLAARSNISLYAKSDITTRGVAPVAEGSSFSTGNTNNSVIFASGSKIQGKRDVFVEALASMRVFSEIRTDSGGLLWDFGDADVQAKGVMNNWIDVQSGSVLSAYDKLSLTAKDGASLTGNKSSRTTFYLIFGIPITRYNSHNSDKDISKTTYSGSNNIYVNGALQSGDGAERILNIETTENGKIEYSGNIEYTKEEMELKIDPKTIQETKKTLEGSFDSENLVNKQKLKIVEANLDGSEDAKTANTNIVNAADKNIDAANLASNGYLDLKDVNSSEWTADQTEILKNSVLASNLSNRAELAPKIKQGSTLTAAELNNIKSALDQSSAKELAKIDGYTKDKSIASAALILNEKDIQKYTESRDTVVENMRGRQFTYDQMMEKLNADEVEVAQGSLKLNYTNIKDTTVRSGEVALNGNVSGSGSISAPGNAFSITVNNNTPGTLNFNDLIIEDNVRGKIYVNNQDVAGADLSVKYNGIDLTLRKADTASQISLNNKVDANDPSFSMGRLINAGDMLFNGLIQNRSGAVNIRNLTGNIISDGTMVAKSISMFVPNGDMKQGFNNSQLDVAGQDGTGSGIYAGGDIEIMARTINLNGVIQSGVADKKIVIKEFELNPNCNEISCFQKIGDEWVELEKSPNKQKSTWYLLNGNKDSGVDMTNPDNPEQIKAYYDIATGEVILFRAEIGGGNITLIGDVVSTGNGEIKLMSGYGHITVDNQSGKNLVVNDLNADKKIDGKLTIYDFNKSVDAIGNKELMDSLAAKYAVADKNELQESDFWSDILKATYKYTAQKENGNVVVSNDANAGSMEAEMLAGVDGAIFKPTEGSQAEAIQKEDYMQVYIPRSWLIEMFFGKEYGQILFPSDSTQRVGAAKDIKVTFMGYNDALIDIRSNAAALKINENISATNGRVTIASKGDILVDSINNQSLVMAKDITLKADGNIGQESTFVKELSIKTDVLGGTLNVGGYDNVSAENVYLADMSGDMGDYDISAAKKAYINVVNGSFLGLNTNQKLTATDTQILAKSGSIQIANGLFNVSGELTVSANDDILVRTEKDINARTIYSEEGNITLASNGSINAISDEDDFMPNVMGKDVTLIAEKGQIGVNVDGKELKIDASGKVKASAAQDINLRSSDNMYVDQITSSKDVRLVSELGIINASENNTYNVKANNLFAVANMGNIENLDVNLDGTLSAYAGYRDVDGKWAITNAQSSIVVNQISKLYTDEEARNLTLTDIARLKDMKIGNVLAQNIFLNSERSIVNAGNGVVINGGRAVLTATAGDIGTSDSFMTVGLDKMISAYAKDKVYLDSVEKDLRIYEIIGINDKQSGSLSVSAGPLSVVSLKSFGNILDVNEEVFVDSKGMNTVNETNNVIAKNIILMAMKDVGTFYDDLNILTLGDGLTAKATNLYVSSLTDMNVQSLDIVGKTVLMARHMDETMKDVWHNVTMANYQGNDLNVHAQNIVVANLAALGNVTLSAVQDITTGNITADNLMAGVTTVGGNLTLTAQNATIQNATVSGVLNANIDNTLNVASLADLNIGTLRGNKGDFINQTILNVVGNIVNAATVGQENIWSVNTDLQATNIGTADKYVSLRIPETGGVLGHMNTTEDAYLNILGGPLTVANLTGKDIVLNTPNDLTVLNAQGDTITLTATGRMKVGLIEARKAFLKTKTQYMQLIQAKISEYLDAKTSDKYVVMNNLSLNPRYDADVQLYAPNKSIYLTLDETQQTKTDFQNVLRHNPFFTIFGTHERHSVNSAILTDLYAAVQNDRAQGLSQNGMDSMTSGLKQGQHHIDVSSYEDVWVRHVNDWVVLNDFEEDNNKEGVKELPRSAFNRLGWFRSMNVNQQHTWLRKFVNH